MKKTVDTVLSDDLRDEYDSSYLKKGIRGKYVKDYQEGTNLILLDSDVAKVFQNDKSVNEALRLLMNITNDPKYGEFRGHNT